MSFEVLEQKIWEHLELVKYSSKSVAESPDRATKFLIMQAFLLEEKRKNEEERAKLTTLVSATFHDALSKVSGGITEKKLAAEKDPEYTEVREFLEICESKISYLRGMLEIFNNAHITFRGLMKEH